MKFTLTNGILQNIDPLHINDTVNKVDSFTTYLHDLKTEGFFLATFDKTPSDFFFGWLLHGLKEIGHFILANDEAFIIIPALVIMFATFFIGRNKFTKFIVPLWFMYFITSLLSETTGLLNWLGK